MDGMTSFDEVFEAYMHQMLYQLDLKMDEMKDFDEESVMATLKKVVSARHADLLEVNLGAMKIGAAN